MKRLVYLLAIVLTLGLCPEYATATTNRLGSVKANEYVVTAESDPTVPEWAKAANPPATGLTTNDVCAIVTNDVGGAIVVGSRFVTPVVYAYSSESVDYAITNIAVRWNGVYWEMHVGGWADMQTYHDGWYKCATTNWNNGEPYSVVNSNLNTDAVTVWIGDKTATGFSQNIGDGLRTFANGTTTYTVTNGVHNALGLAYERDLTNLASRVTGLSTAMLTTNDVGGIIASSNLASAATVTALASAKRDLTNNICAADYFTPWARDNLPSLPSGMTWSEQPVEPTDGNPYWFWFTENDPYGLYTATARGDGFSVMLTFGSDAGFFTATRSRVAHSNDVYTTYTFVTNAVANSADKATVNALVTTTATHTATIADWETYWSGDKVRLSVTNYYGNSSGEMPRLRIEESQTNAQGVVTNWIQVWDEEARHTNYQATVDAKVDAISNVLMTATWQQTATQLAGKAPKAWGEVTSGGVKAPVDTVWMTAPNTVFAGGTEYAHVAVGEGTICVLVDNGAPVYTEGEEGTFRFKDDSGQYYFGFDIRESYTLGCRTDGISVNNASHLVSLTYDLTSSDNPEILTCTNLLTGTWTTAEVTWEQNPPVAGTKVCYIDVGTNPQGFYKAQINYAGGAKFITNMQADLAGGIAASNETLNVIQNIYPVITSTGVVWRVKN